MTTTKNPFRFYVYAYLRSKDSITGKKGTPYYIGKGCGNRAFRKHKNIPLPKDKTNIIIISGNLSEDASFALEIEMISKYGRINDGTGILRNITCGGEGTSGRVTSRNIITGEIKNVSSEEFYANDTLVSTTLGMTHSIETRMKMRKPKSEQGKSNMRGLERTAEHIENLRISRLENKIINRVCDIETRIEYETSTFLLINTLATIVGDTGKTVKELQTEKATQTKIKNGSCFGNKNPAAKHIHIYDNLNILRFVCCGNFGKVCLENNLPERALSNSYRNSGKPVKLTPGFVGWYSVIIPKSSV
jgi:hypothetical protein